MSVHDKKRIEFLEKEVSKAMDAVNLLVAKNDKQREAYFKTESLYFSQKAITELAVKGLAMELNVAIGTQNKHATTRLDTLLSEIERLTHAK
jgi:hypothetical protein